MTKISDARKYCGEFLACKECDRVNCLVMESYLRCVQLEVENKNRILKRNMK